MKKIILISFLSCISVLIFAQIPTIKIINDVDFWNGEEEIRSLSADFETTGNVLHKRFFSNTKTVWQEYLKISKDSFLFVQYDKNTHEVLQEGKVLPMLCCSRNDTTLSYDPETYEEQSLVRRKMKFGKEDEWLEVGDAITERGVYKNNKRTGEWRSWNNQAPWGEKYTYYNMGEILYTEPGNIAETQDSSQIARRLLGNCWAMDEWMPNRMEYHTYDKSEYSYRYGFLEFSTNALVYTQKRGCGEGNPPHSVGTWSLKGDILSITGTALLCKKYKIVFLGKDVLHLQEI